jgi:hypothetical protein
MRGFAAGQILVTIMVISFNLRSIAKFLRDEVEAGAGPSSHSRYRPAPIPRLG